MTEVIKFLLKWDGRWEIYTEKDNNLSIYIAKRGRSVVNKISHLEIETANFDILLATAKRMIMDLESRIPCEID